VNQSCVRLIESGPQRLDGMARRQFFSYAAAVMRSVVVDLARERLTDRRGNGEVLRIDMLSVEPSTDDGDPLVIDRALTELRAREPRLAEVVEMRFFGGFSETEIADALGLSERSVRRDWEKARTLMRMLLA
jgi:RNA polymerase sigma factor (TIGR02999 family)